MMAEHPEAGLPRYSAFISYSHRDTAFARRLHRRLETYRLPGRLARALGGRGRRLGPIFRDRDDLAASPDLTQSVRDALARSRNLIVVCSPGAAASEWVAREIELFREMHPVAPVLAALWRGPLEGSLPLPMRRDPALGGQGPSPLAADFRPHGDGRLALLKLVAAIAGASLDELVQRYAQRGGRRALWAATGVGIAATLAGVMIAAVVETGLRARAERARGEKVYDFADKDLRASLKSVGRFDLLKKLDDSAVAFVQGKGRDALSDDDRAKEAEALQTKGSDDITRGDFAAADSELGKAWRETRDLLDRKPRDPKRIFDHAQSEYWVGAARWRQGDGDAAAAHFQAYADLSRRLVAAAPGNPDWVMERGYAASDQGMLALRRSIDTARAGPLFRSAQDDFESVQRLRPGDRDIQIQVEDGHGWLADVRRLQGDWAGALRERLIQRRQIERLEAEDPRDFQAREFMVTNDLALGRIAYGRGDPVAAAARLRAARQAALALARQDPENREAASQARAIGLFLAQAWIAEPAGKRPPDGEIAKALGDCDEPAAEPDHLELSAFCHALQAPWRRERRLLPDPSQPAPTRPYQSDRLTPRWRIDLAAAASPGAPPRPLRSLWRRFVGRGRCGWSLDDRTIGLRRRRSLASRLLQQARLSRRFDYPTESGQDDERRQHRDSLGQILG